MLRGEDPPPDPPVRFDIQYTPLNGDLNVNSLRSWARLNDGAAKGVVPIFLIRLGIQMRFQTTKIAFGDWNSPFLAIALAGEAG